MVCCSVTCTISMDVATLQSALEAAGEKPYGHEKQLAKHEHRADGTLIAPA